MITPMEIQNREFNKRWQGYNPEEVKHFLYAIAEEFEKLLEQSHRMARQLDQLRERVRDMESREKVLNDTLVSAQSIKVDIRRNAEKDAELVVKEAQLKADDMHETAKKEVDRIFHQMAEIRRMRNDLLAEAEMMVSRFGHFVDAEREQAEEADKLQNFASRRKRQKAAREGESGEKGEMTENVMARLDTLTKEAKAGS